MVRPQEPDKIPINSPHDLHVEVDALVHVFQLTETEDTWEKINRAVKRFQATVRGGACRFTDDFLHAMRDPRVVKGIVRSLVTERTALSGTTLELVASCTRLGHHFAALLPHYLPTLLRLFARPNKVYVTRAASTIASIIRNTRLGEVVRFIVLEWRNEPGKSASFREQAAAAVVIILGADGDTLGVDKESLERRVEDLEWLIKTGATGREASVRSDMKKCWEVYKREWPERVPSFTAPMTPTIRKYLKVTDALPGATLTAASRPPPRKPATLSASTGPSSHALSRPAATLAKSHGPPALSHAPSRAALSHSTAPARSQPLAASTPDSLGLGAPSLRATRVEPTRTASGSSSSSATGAPSQSSRSVSRCDERDALAASTSSLRTAAHLPARTGFKPTAPGGASATVGSKTGPLANAARPAARALPTAASASASAGAEPRKARRVAPPPPAPPEPAPVPARSQMPLNRSQGASAAPPPVPVPAASVSHAPFRPKLNASVASAASGPAAGAGAKPKPASRAPVAAPAPASRPPARAPRTAAAATAGTASSRAAAASSVRSAPSAATLASRERRAAREAARLAEMAAKHEAEADKARGERQRAEEAAAMRAVDAHEREVRERERERAGRIPLPPVGEDEDVQSEAGMDSEMMLESLPASQVPVVTPSQEEQVDDAPTALAVLSAAPIAQPAAVFEHDTAALKQDSNALEVVQPIEVAASTEVAQPFMATALCVEEEQATPGEPSEAEATQSDEEVLEDQPAPTDKLSPEPVRGQHDEPAQIADHDQVERSCEVVEPEQRVPLEVEDAAGADESADVMSASNSEDEDDLEQDSARLPDEQDEPVCASPVRDAAPVWNDSPPSPMLAKAQEASREAVTHQEALEREDEPADLEREEEVADARVRARSASPVIDDELDTVAASAADLCAAPSTPLFATYTPPASTPALVTRPSPPFTPTTATPARPGVRFPAPSFQYSPEPFQTASIVLDTPPRLDELPGAVRLPTRVALPVAVAVADEAEASDDEEEESDEGEIEEDEEDEVLPASPLARKTASPPAERPQAIFLDDYHASSPYDDADTTFEADESLDTSVDADEGDTSLAETALAAAESSAAETEAVSAEPSREYAVPLNDTSAYDHLARPEEAEVDEQEYDDSSAGEEDSASADTTRIARSPVRADELVAAVPAAAREESPDANVVGGGLPVSPAGSTTQEFSFFGAPVASTPSGRSRHQEYWDASLLDDESACFELEQPQLRFHDETESEHEASLASTVLADLDLDIDVEPRRGATPPTVAAAEPPQILQRSLRNRTVTVELQTPAASKPLTRSTRSAARGVLGELQH